MNNNKIYYSEGLPSTDNEIHCLSGEALPVYTGIYSCKYSDAFQNFSDETMSKASEFGTDRFFRDAGCRWPDGQEIFLRIK